MRHGLAVFFAGSLIGCANNQGVRYVYQDRDFGVIGMPENTDCWPTHYRRQGERLMGAHLREGYEIVRAEEVIEGVRTVKVEGSRSTELAPQVSQSLIKVIKLGHSASRSQADTIKATECRIIYRRAALGDADNPTSASLTPTWYVDPNAAERRKATEPPHEKAKSPAVHKAAVKPSD